MDDDFAIGSQQVLDRRRERLLLLMLASVQFTSIVDFMVVMPLGPQLMRSLQIKPSQFGLIVSSYTVAAGLAGLTASSVLDAHRVGELLAQLTPAEQRRAVAGLELLAAAARAFQATAPRRRRW